MKSPLLPLPAADRRCVRGRGLTVFYGVEPSMASFALSPALIGVNPSPLKPRGYLCRSRQKADRAARSFSPADWTMVCRRSREEMPGPACLREQQHVRKNSGTGNPSRRRVRPPFQNSAPDPGEPYHLVVLGKKRASAQGDQARREIDCLACQRYPRSDPAPRTRRRAMSDQKTPRPPALAGSASPKPRRRANPFDSYEALKTRLTADVSTPGQYEAACRRAARLAGV